VARIADMLLNPGTTYRYNGETRVYPDIWLVYRAGGNPFHHHQDLNRLRKAFARLDTLVVPVLGCIGAGDRDAVAVDQRCRWRFAG
jgi:biotin/methionine sulfoxide reductase